MPTRTRWRVACAGVVGLLLGGAVFVGCQQSGERQGPPPASTRTFEGHPVLEPWAQAVRDSDDEAANVVVLGDSVSEGYGLEGDLERRWVDRLQRTLRSRADVPDCPTDPGGFRGTTSVVPAQYRAPSLPQPSTRGRVAPAPQYGPGGRAVELAPGASVSWQVEAESVDVGYRTRSDGGSLQVRIDGEIPIEGFGVPTRSEGEGPAGEGEREVWSSRDLGPGDHRVTVRNSSGIMTGSPVTVTDITPFRGDRDRCVHVLDASRSGVSARTITQTPTYLADALSLEPDLLLVPLGFNDARSGVSPGEFGGVLDTLIGQVRQEGYGGPMLLVGWFTPAWGDTTTPPWADYLDQMAERTDREAVSFIDLSAVLPAVGWAPEGVYMDGLHPGPGGQPLIAESLVEPLAPRPEG